MWYLLEEWFGQSKNDGEFDSNSKIHSNRVTNNMKCLYSTVRSSALTDKINQDFFISLKLTRDPELVYKHDYIGLQKTVSQN